MGASARMKCPNPECRYGAVWAVINPDWPSGTEPYREARDCERCDGAGEIPDDECPSCGEKLRTALRVRGSVEFVDRLCDYCEYRDIDMEGGV
jgi:hypothetical protein